MEVAVTALSGILIYRHVHFLRKHLKGHLYLVVRKLRNPEAHIPRSPASRAGGSRVLGREQARSDHHPGCLEKPMHLCRCGALAQLHSAKPALLSLLRNSCKL